MANLTTDEIETMVLARSLIRDMARRRPARELAAHPESVAARITSLLGGTYDFATGDSSTEEEGDVK